MDDDELALEAEAREYVTKALNKKNMYVLESDKDRICVLFQERGKNKIAWLRRDYWHRYGVGTVATVKPGSRIPWSADQEITEKYLTRLLEFDTSGLEKFDVSMLTEIKW